MTAMALAADKGFTKEAARGTGIGGFFPGLASLVETSEP